MPGRTSMTSPSLKTPYNNVPPKMPPYKSVALAPALLLSKLRTVMRSGGDFKSRVGSGISAKAETMNWMLRFLVAEIGTIRGR